MVESTLPPQPPSITRAVDPAKCFFPPACPGCSNCDPLRPASAIAPTKAKAMTRTCDALLKGGRRNGKSCGARANHYDPREKRNLCGYHAQFALAPLRGVGPAWYDDPLIGCDTSGHEACEVRRIVDGVAMCVVCSYDYEMADLRRSLAGEVA